MAIHHFSELLDGFSVERPFGRRVAVRLQPWAFHIFVDGQRVERIGLCQRRRLIERTATALAWDQLQSLEQEPWEVCNTIIRNTERAIARYVEVQQRRLLVKVDPLVLAVQRAVFRTTYRHSELTEHEEFYRERDLVRDVLRFDAAAIALARYRNDGWRCVPSSCSELHPEPTPSRREERPLACAPANRSLPVRDRINALTEWRDVFSPTRESYRSLDRTLMNLPPDLGTLAYALRHVVLERAMTNRLELQTLLRLLVGFLSDGGVARDPEMVGSQIRILQHATELEIRRGMARVAAHLRETLKPDSDGDVDRFVTFLAAYGEPQRGRLGGLVERAIRRHRAHPASVATIAGLGAAEPTARPPIPLPRIIGVSFLDTIGAVIVEGERMDNCIASLAGAATAGRCYLFRVEHGGETASVQVSAEGEVLEAAGPRNTTNDAAIWGARRLSYWGRSLRTAVEGKVMGKMGE
jgi:hypothetical protein